MYYIQPTLNIETVVTVHKNSNDSPDARDYKATISMQ